MLVKYFIHSIIQPLIGAEIVQKEASKSIESYIESFFSGIGGVSAILFFLIFFFHRLIQGYDKKYDDVESGTQKIKDSIEVLQKEINHINIKLAEHKSSAEAHDLFRKDLQQTINDMNRLQGIVQGILRAIDQLEKGRNSNV